MSANVVDNDGGANAFATSTVTIHPPTLNYIQANDGGAYDTVTDEAPIADATNPTRDLYLQQNDASKLAFVLSAEYSPGTNLLGQFVLWKAVGGSVSPSHGNFADYGTASIVISPTSGVYDCSIEVGPDTNGDGTLGADEVTRQFNVHGLDMSAKIMTASGPSGDLPASAEKTTGSFIPVNDDDDDYDGTPDHQDTGSIVGEDDLLPIVLHKTTGSDPGYYQVSVPGTFLLFQNSDRTGPIDNNTEISAAADTTIYAEATAVGDGQVNVEWQNHDMFVRGADHAVLGSFDGTGPHNVPGHAAYEYKDIGGPSDGKWVSATGGTIKSGVNSKDVTVLWDSGPIVGTVVYTAGPDTWRYAVNVVEVEVNQTFNEIDYVQSPVQIDPVDDLLLDSGIDRDHPSMHAQNYVSVLGPIVDGHQRGADRIQVGMIQDMANTSIYADYGANSRKVMYYANGLSLSTMFIDSSFTTGGPWYDGTNAREVFQGTETDTLPSHALLQIWDRPASHATNEEKDPNGNWVTRFTCDLSFNLYVAVRTLDDENGSASVFTQRAAASWICNLDGDVTQAGGVITWHPDVGAGSNGDEHFAEVDDGTLVPVTTGIHAIDMAGVKKWKWQ